MSDGLDLEQDAATQLAVVRAVLAERDELLLRTSDALRSLYTDAPQRVGGEHARTLDRIKSIYCMLPVRVRE